VKRLRQRKGISTGAIYRGLPQIITRTALGSYGKAIPRQPPHKRVPGRCGVIHTGSYTTCTSSMYRGTSLIRKRPPPKDQHRALGIGLL